jgi:ankyrin repeat protein
MELNKMMKYILILIFAISTYANTLYEKYPKLIPKSNYNNDIKKHYDLALAKVSLKNINIIMSKYNILVDDYKLLYKLLDNYPNISDFQQENKSHILNDILHKYAIYKSDKSKNKDILKVARLLIRKGLSLTKKDKYNESALDILLNKDYNLELREFIYDVFKNNNLTNITYKMNKQKTNWNPLFYAISRNDTKLFNLLIEQKVNLNYKDENGINALYLSVFMSNLEFAKILVQKGIRLDTKTNIKNPLKVAAFNSDINSTKYLISIGYNPYAPIVNFKDSLHFILINPNKDMKRPKYAYKKISLEYIEYIVKLFKNKINTFKYTPLSFIAPNTQMIDTLKILLKYNANINFQDKDGDTPLHQYVLDYSTLSKLIKKFENTKENKTKVNHSKRRDVQGILDMAFGAKYIYKDKVFKQKQMYYLEAIKFLIQNKADKSIKNKNEVSAYELAKELNLDDKILKVLRYE